MLLFSLALIVMSTSKVGKGGWSVTRANWCGYPDFFDMELQKQIFREPNEQVECIICSHVYENGSKSDKYCCGTAKPLNRTDMKDHLKKRDHRDAKDILLGAKGDKSEQVATSSNSDPALTPSQKKSRFFLFICKFVLF
jgi:hypothetical protein